MKIALAQINPTVGDFHGNTAKIVDYTHQAAAANADLVVFSELAICGYPSARSRRKAQLPDALRSRPSSSSPPKPPAFLSPSSPATSDAPTSALETNAHTNSAAVIRGGKILLRQPKMLLPTYDVFDEDRYFVPADRQKLSSPRRQARRRRLRGRLE